MPFISLGLSVLLLFIPRIDPQKKNVEAFKKYNIGFVAVLLLFMLYIFVLTILWNLNTRFNMVQLLVPAFAVVSYAVGVLLQKSKQNWFIGIRTPWTLSSDRVWDRTHSIGGRLFKAAGLVSLLGIFFQNYAILFILVPLISVAVFTIVYSYVDYQKETRRQSRR